MTREEAIEFGKMWLQISENCKGSNTYAFFQMAIKALEQESALDKIKAEIKEWYWQADKQALAKDSCVVDAMVDLFIRTIYKYKAESEDKE